MWIERTLWLQDNPFTRNHISILLHAPIPTVLKIFEDYKIYDGGWY